MIGVVIINFGNPERTIRFVREECVKIGVPHQVVIVDNGSGEDALAQLQAALLPAETAPANPNPAAAPAAPNPAPAPTTAIPPAMRSLLLPYRCLALTFPKRLVAIALLAVHRNKKPGNCPQNS